MPLDKTIKKVLVIGSGPIVIGQAAEFDYSGTQAIKALKEENVEVVLVNSNPATIMTDRNVADKTYIEPLTVAVLEKVIAKERPDALIAGMGGQTGLNLSVELYDSGVLEKYGVRVIGTSIESIKKGEDRELFKNLMQEINQPIVESVIVTTLKGGLDFAGKFGYPVVIRPAYTLGGTGGGIADTEDELKEILSLGLSLSRVGQALIEKCIRGWKEIEFEIIRDADGNCVTVCSMENVDPVGVHTGDSIVVAPAQTLSGKEYKLLNYAAIDIVTALDIVGGCNIQFAQKPDGFDYAVIEVNPRVSRSSALASKATGYPIAKVSSKIALGLRLDEIKNALTQTTYACFEPTVDYCVVKIPKWPFDKFIHAKKTLGTKMMATGEVMAIAGSFEAALLKGIRSLEIGQYSLVHATSTERSLDELKRRVQIPDDERIFDLAEMLRRNYRIDKVSEITGVDKFFIKKISNIVDNEEMLKEMRLEDISAKKMRELKRMGFSDKGIASLVGCKPNEVYERRKKFGILPVYKMVDTCAGEYSAVTPYYYSTYDTEDEVVADEGKKVIVIGSGPIRIGQGIEFDYCSVQSILALKKKNIKTIIINNNPETVSTDFDTADKLYFEPLTEEDVLSIIEKEKPDGVILQFGGQTAIKLASFLKDKGIPIYGTKPEQIDVAEDREKFDALLEKLEITRPQGKSIWSIEEGLEAVKELGFPVLVRPSYVLGGRGMEITYEESELIMYLKEAFSNDKDNPILVDKYVEGTEIEIDAICDGTDVLIPGIMEHLERAGVHSGDSISIYPSQSISQSIKNEIESVTAKMAIALEVKGMINIQFIEQKGILYIIEVNPRSSRTVPYISKVTGLPCIEIATRVMLGEKLSEMPYGTGLYKETSMVSVKVPVFSTEKLPMVEVSLGPEMRSTGEVLGIGEDFITALCKGFIAAKLNIPKPGSKILATIRTKDQENFVPLAKRLKAMDCEITATQGTAETLARHGIPTIRVKKINEGIPNILDTIRSGLIDMTVNIPIKVNDYETDGFKIRRVSAECSILQITSLDTVEAIIQVMESGIDEKNIQIYAVDEII